MLANPASAEHCTTWSTSHPEVDTDPLDLTGFRMYVDNDNDPRFLFSIWIYMESNGIPGLQRGDQVVDDTCHDMIEADTIPCMLLPVALLTPRKRKGGQASPAAAAAVGLALVGTVAIAPTVEAC